MKDEEQEVKEEEPEEEQEVQHLQVAVLAGGLEGGVPGEHPVDVAVGARHQLLQLGLVAVSGGLDELLHHVPRHVRLEQLLQQGREPLAGAGDNR